jgi:hypothetical protein
VDIFIGEMVEAFADETILTGGAIDLAKLKPLLFDMSTRKYWGIGPVLANCWQVGRELKKKK